MIGAGIVTSLQVEVGGCEVVVVAGFEYDGFADEVVRISVEVDGARLEDDEDSLDNEDTGVEVEIASADVDDAVGVAEQ